VTPSLAQMFSDSAEGSRGKTVGLYAVLIAANGLAWIWALVTFAGQPTLLGTALLAYTLGLRHAVDADHIAAIDNVVRTLMQEGKRPHSLGFFFALGAFDGGPGRDPGGGRSRGRAGRPPR
jgi:nickel/cobalt transporter (NiCoT) family protein